MSTISSVGGSSYTQGMMHGGPRGARRPDSNQMADDIFSQLDTNNQGYLQASDFSNAISQLNGSNGSSNSNSSDTSGEDIFAALDTDKDGKVTKSELSTRLKELSDQLDSQFNAMRTQAMAQQGGAQGAQGGMPPPPPGGGRGGDHDGDGGGKSKGLDQTQLSAMAKAAGDAGDTQAADRFSQLASNFDDADSNGDGKVSFAESIAYEKSQQSSSASSTTTTTSSSSSSTTTTSSSISEEQQSRVMMRLMDMMRSYGQQDDAQNSSSLSLSA